MWEIKSCTKNDKYYPKAMLEVGSAPDVLYYVGDITICNNTVIAVIGKRDAKERHLKIARKIGEQLGKAGFTVLNGLAVGCDTYALEGAIEANGKVIAIMPGGLDEIYPKSNRELAERIVAKGGCIISEYSEGTRPQKYTFVQRDRIQAMLSDKVFVVDCEKNGGTMHTVDYAVKLSKPIGCFEEEDTEKTPEGNWFLIETNKAISIKDTESLMRFARLAKYVQLLLFQEEN